MVSIERIDETRAFEVSKRLAVALMRQRQPLERSRNRSVNSPMRAKQARALNKIGYEKRVQMLDKFNFLSFHTIKFLRYAENLTKNLEL